ncbi:MAG: hypothetical protein FJ104_04575, partial [Deltaproteobacteria bacterium]|nr:hypothetical protein [Deltaproteobacteria bacterium]
LGLARGGSTLVRLRAAGGKRELRVALEPKTLHADVALGPRRATWPADRVTLDVALRDERRGRTLPESVQVDTTVTVNLEPVKVEFHREGARLRAAVPLPATGGPWVVRAEVRDSAGELLGRDVLDVVPSTGPGGRLAAR